MLLSFVCLYYTYRLEFVNIFSRLFFIFFTYKVLRGTLFSASLSFAGLLTVFLSKTSTLLVCFYYTYRQRKVNTFTQKNGKDFLFSGRGVFYLQKKCLTFAEKNAWWFRRDLDNSQGCLTQSIHLKSKNKN